MIAREKKMEEIGFLVDYLMKETVSSDSCFYLISLSSGFNFSQSCLHLVKFSLYKIARRRQLSQIFSS